MVRQPAHRRPRRRHLSVLVRLAVTLALALLTLPALNASAVADDTGNDPAAGTLASDPTGDPPADPAPSDPAPDTSGTSGTTSGTSGSGTSGSATSETSEPVGSSGTSGPATTDTAGTSEGGTSTGGTSTGGPKQRTTSLLAAPALVAYDAALKALLTAATYQPVDEQGANDEPGQKDLTRLWGFSPSGGHQKIGWNWDETAWSGSNTGDACALFDTDQDGNANYAVCVTVHDDPATQLDSVSNPSPRLYSCNDTRSTNCYGPVLLSSGAGSTVDCQVGQTDTDPFPAGDENPADTSAFCDIPLAAVGGGDTVLTNVCSYPSQQPNSDWSDCVLAPRDALLTVEKTAHPADGTGFVFSVEPAGGLKYTFATLESGEHYSAGVTSGKTISLTEALPEGWDQTSATCDNGQAPGALKLESGAHVTCSFVNTRSASVTVDKYWVVNGGDPVADGDQPAHLGLSADLSLTGQGDPSFGTTYAGYLTGDQVTVDESTTITNDLCTPDKATIAPDGEKATDLPDAGYAATLSSGDNGFTMTNYVVCDAHLRLVKQVANGPAPAGAWTLGADTASGATAFTPGSSGVEQDITADATYTLHEDDADPGYVQQGGWSCTHGVTANGAGEISVGAGRSTTCTVTNVTAALVLKKSVTNDDGGTAAASAFLLTATDASDPTDDFSVIGTASGVTTWVRPGTTWDLTESGPAGYALVSLKCDTGPAGALTSATSVTPGAGDTVTCTFTNDDRPAHLTLQKVVDDAGSGTDVTAADFTLTATLQGAPGTVVSGNGDPASAGGVDGVPVSAGTWALAETGPAGFTAGTWDCGQAHPVTHQDGLHLVTIGLEQDVTCQIVNTAQKPTLTLVKKVAGNAAAGGTAQPGDWTLRADGPETLTGSSGVSKAVLLGSYHLSESGGPDGYAPSAWDCGDHAVSAGTVTLGLGEQVTCTITNTARPAHLTLVKHVDNGDTGADHTADEWTLTAAGPATVTGSQGDAAIVGQAVPAGSYDLSESGPGDYAAPDGWVCDGEPVADSVTLALGEDVTCAITNVAVAPRLTLVKVVDGNEETGGTAAATDWTLHAVNGGAVVEGVTGSDDVTGVATVVGDYDLSETGGPAGYTAGAWVCVDGEQEQESLLSVLSDVPTLGDAVTLGLGDDVTCTIHNVAQPAHLTLVKHVDNADTDGTAVPEDWTLSAADGEVVALSGAGGASGPVLAGVYDLAEQATAVDRTEGYTASAWTCDGAPSDGTVTVALGDDVTCEVTNTATPGSWLVTKASDPASGSTVLPGDTITYTVTAEKTGGVDPTDVEVFDDLSQVLDHATLVPGSVTASSGTAAVDPATQELSWTIPVLHRTETVTYQVVVADGAYGVTLRNLVTSPGSDGCPAEQPGCDTTEHVTPAWQLTKTSDPADGAEVEPGDDITYTLTAVNTSDAVVAGAQAVDDLSQVLDHANLDAAGLADGLTLAGTELTWAVPTLDPGERASVSYTVTVDGDAYAAVLDNVVAPVGAGGACVTDDDCATTHHTGPRVLGEEAVRPRPPAVLGTSLPDTGAPSHARLLGLVGAATVAVGALLMAAERRRRVPAHRSEVRRH